MATLIQPLFTDEENEAFKRILDYLAGEEKEYADLPPEERPNHIFHSVLVLRANGLIHRARFDTGKVCYTPGARQAMEEAKQAPWQFLVRHTAGDWGDVYADDWRENELSLENGFRLLSSYRTTAGERLWIITEADRSATTILLPEDY